MSYHEGASFDCPQAWPLVMDVKNATFGARADATWASPPAMGNCLVVLLTLNIPGSHNWEQSHGELYDVQKLYNSC